MGAVMMKVESIKYFVQHSGLRFMQFSLFLAFVPLIALMVKRKEYPTNMYLLAAFTFFEAYGIGVVVTFYDQAVVLQAAVLTAAITVGLTAFTFQTKRDFTFMNGSLISFLWVLIGLAFIQMFAPFSSGLDIIVAIAGAMCFSAFIVVDTQLLMKKMSTDEYILCAINLYLDIINLFLEILRILGRDR
jgi:FtsH-binding integral membrane protein